MPLGAVLLEAATILAFVAVLLVLDRRHRAEIAQLCQRLQAPATAVIDHSLGGQASADAPTWVSPFDDEAMNELLERRHGGS